MKQLPVIIPFKGGKEYLEISIREHKQKEILMNCPSCNIDLAIGERAGLSIDYCPKCRGIWLEKNKLDQIIDRSRNDDGRGQGSHRNEEENEGFFGKITNMFD